MSDVHLLPYGNKKQRAAHEIMRFFLLFDVLWSFL